MKNEILNFKNSFYWSGILQIQATTCVGGRLLKQLFRLSGEFIEFNFWMREHVIIYDVNT